MTSLILLLFVFAIKALADTIKFHWHGFKLKKYLPTWLVKYLNPDNWQLAWKDGDYTKGERFWGSSRWFIAFVDGWHMLDAIRNYLTILVVLSAMRYDAIVYAKVIDAVLLFCCYSMVFEYLFKRLSNK